MLEAFFGEGSSRGALGPGRLRLRSRLRRGIFFVPKKKWRERRGSNP